MGNPVTYKHIKDTCNDLGVELKILKSKKYDGMVDLAKKKGRFPSTKARFCTEELKTKPMIDYILDRQDHCLIVQGIRAAESFSRSQMAAQCTYFKYYFQPYLTNSMIVQQYEALPNLSMVQRRKLEKAKARLAKGKEDAKYHTYRKEDVEAFVKTYSADIIRPHFDKPDQYVIDYIIDNGQQPNPMYFEGSKRVGCWPCMQSGQQEVLELIRRHPERMDAIEAYEEEVNSSFFKVDYIPEKFRTGFDPKSGKTFSKAKDIRKYLLEKNLTGNLFVEDEAISCSSYYHLCE